MEYTAIRNFIDSIQEYSDDEILKNFIDILWYLNKVKNYRLAFEFEILALKTIKDINKKTFLMQKLFYINLNNKNFYNWEALIEILKYQSEEERVFIFRKLFNNIKSDKILNILDLPMDLRYGVELEYHNPSLKCIKELYKNGMIKQIFEALNIENDNAKSIISNSEFEVMHHFDKWVFSKETNDDLPEISSPILTNNLNDLNMLGDICLLFKTLGSTTNNETGLHINIGYDYFKGNFKAIEILLKIWSECEELFFKIANETGEVIRNGAFYIASPIKGNIEKTFAEQDSLCIKDEEESLRFLYNIQVRNRLLEMIPWENDDLKMQLSNAKNEDERFYVFKEYILCGKNKSALRYVSINFSYVNFLKNDGRIEFRLFNSTLSLKNVLLALLLVGKLCEVSFKICNNPTYKQEEYNDLFNRNVTEREKLELLLRLLFGENEVKKIYIQRWESIKDKRVYEDFKAGTDTFVSDEAILKYKPNNN